MQRRCRWSLLLPLLILAACSKDLGRPEPDNPLIGTWDHAAVYVDGDLKPCVVWDAGHNTVTWWGYDDPVVAAYPSVDVNYTFAADGTFQREVILLQQCGGPPKDDASPTVTTGTYAIDGAMLFLWTESYAGQQSRFFTVGPDTLTMMIRDQDRTVTWYLVRHVEE